MDKAAKIPMIKHCAYNAEEFIDAEKKYDFLNPPNMSETEFSTMLVSEKMNPLLNDRPVSTLDLGGKVRFSNIRANATLRIFLVLCFIVLFIFCRTVKWTGSGSL